MQCEPAVTLGKIPASAPITAQTLQKSKSLPTCSLLLMPESYRFSFFSTSAQHSTPSPSPSSSMDFPPSASLTPPLTGSHPHWLLSVCSTSLLPVPALTSHLRGVPRLCPWPPPFFIIYLLQLGSIFRKFNIQFYCYSDTTPTLPVNTSLLSSSIIPPPSHKAFLSELKPRFSQLPAAQQQRNRTPKVYLFLSAARSPPLFQLHLNSVCFKTSLSLHPAGAPCPIKILVLSDNSAIRSYIFVYIFRESDFSPLDCLLIMDLKTFTFVIGVCPPVNVNK